MFLQEGGSFHKICHWVLAVPHPFLPLTGPQCPVGDGVSLCLVSPFTMEVWEAKPVVSLAWATHRSVCDTLWLGGPHPGCGRDTGSARPVGTWDRWSLPRGRAVLPAFPGAPPPLYSPSPSSFSTAYFLSLLWPLSCRDGTLTETSGDAAWPSVSCLRAPWAHDESLAVHAIRERDGKSWPSALQKQRRVTANRELVCACMCVCFLSYQ